MNEQKADYMGVIIPLKRSPELMALVQRVTENLPDDPDFSDEWIEHLVKNLSQFDD